MYIYVDYNPTPADTFFVSIGLNDKECLSFDYTTKGHRVMKQVLVSHREKSVGDLDKKEISGGWDEIQLKDGKFIKREHIDWIDKGEIDEVNNEVWKIEWAKPISDDVRDKLLNYSQYVSDNYENLDEEKMKEFEIYVGNLIKNLI